MNRFTTTQTQPIELERRLDGKDRSMVFLNDEEAAEFLRVSVDTIRRWRLERKGPRYRRHGSLIRYAISDLIIFSDRSAIEPQKVV